MKDLKINTTNIKFIYLLFGYTILLDTAQTDLERPGWPQYASSPQVLGLQVYTPMPTVESDLNLALLGIILIY